MDERDIIAKNIIFYRKKLNLSQLELSEKLQYSNKNISKWEKGETTPSIFTLKRLAEIFGITLDELVSTPAEDREEVETLPKKEKTKLPTKILYLLMSNAILLVLAFIAIWVLRLIGVQRFNKWLLLLYILPLSAISVFVFIACVKKRADIISLSIAGWLTALCVFLSLKSVSGIGYIFILMAGIQILTLLILLIINVYVKNREKKKGK